MTVDQFRDLALALPEATEATHTGHPDFRVSGKIFATLGPPGTGWGMVKLTPLQQRAFTSLQPRVFAPVAGAWGRGGLFARPGKPGSDARRHEPIGSYALPVRMAMGPALELFEQVGLAAIEARTRELAEHLRTGLDGIPRVCRVGPSSPEVTSAGITLFEIPGVKPEDFQARALRHHGLHVDEHARNDLQAVRVSTHFYNARAELDRLLEAVKAEARNS